VQLAGNHENLQQAYMSVKRGRACRYRQQSTSLAELTVPKTYQMASVTPPAIVAAICQPDRLSSLENKLQERPKKFDDLTLFSRNTSNRTSNIFAIMGFNCEQKGQIITKFQVNFNIWCALSFL